MRLPRHHWDEGLGRGERLCTARLRLPLHFCHRLHRPPKRHTGRRGRQTPLRRLDNARGRRRRCEGPAAAAAGDCAGLPLGTHIRRRCRDAARRVAPVRRSSRRRRQREPWGRRQGREQHVRLPLARTPAPQLHHAQAGVVSPRAHSAGRRRRNTLAEPWGNHRGEARTHSRTPRCQARPAAVRARSRWARRRCREGSSGAAPGPQSTAASLRWRRRCCRRCRCDSAGCDPPHRRWQRPPVRSRCRGRWDRSRAEARGGNSCCSPLQPLRVLRPRARGGQGGRRCSPLHTPAGGATWLRRRRLHRGMARRRPHRGRGLRRRRW
jgi:hypothetical protein